MGKIDKNILEIKKRGVILLRDYEGFKKLEDYPINDTVCVVGSGDFPLKVASYLNERYGVSVKLITDNEITDLSKNIEIINVPIKQIVGGNKVEAIKLENGRVIKVCWVIFIDKEEEELHKNEAETIKLISQMANEGLNKILTATKDTLSTMLLHKGKDTPIGFLNTNYYLPLINALLNIEVKNLSDCSRVLKQIEDLSKLKPTAHGFIIDTANGIFNKGIATLLCEELLAALSVLDGKHPTGGMGFIPDNILRSLGLQLVDGRIAGIAVILGPAKEENLAVDLIRELQSKNIVSLLAGEFEKITFKKQLESKGVEIGLENYIIPLGDDYLSAIYAVNFAIRAPLTFGGFKPGQWQEIIGYLRQRVPAFILLLSYVDEVIAATGLGALAFGFPIITDLEIGEIGKLETTLYDALISEKDYKKLVSRCILSRGIKVKISKVDIPVAYAAAFEGERVRKENLYIEFGGKSEFPSFEYLKMSALDKIEDGKIELFGPDIDEVKNVKSLPLAIVVEVAGRKMQKDFEPILERQIHRFINYAQGIMHIGQRDMNWIRISKEAFNKGFRLKHIGVILHAMFHQEYSSIVDKVKVSLYTEEEKVKELLKEAQKAYLERDERLAGMIDENVDVYFSCVLCQSFAPNHVCIITPERLGLCGAYSWLDAKASYEILPSGPNQPILKKEMIDERLGQWKSINDFVYQKSNKTIEKVSLYSIMEYPMSSCGCFECIVLVLAETNGVMIVHRDYSGMTPCGMTFTTLAGSVGGGVQTPGFMGVGKLYITSKKFISAEGGILRVVWMPKELKELLADKIRKRAQELGYPDLLEKICDETITTDIHELLNFLQKVKHPVLDMPPIL